MTKTGLDTSVLVAAFQTWHTAHERARAGLDRVLEEDAAVVPVHALIETYSVLTRMPRSLRLSADDAFRLLDETLRGKAEIAGLGDRDAFDFLDATRLADVTGGAVYDAFIAAAAQAVGARRLLTLNPRHFERVSPEGLEVVEP